MRKSKDLTNSEISQIQTLYSRGIPALEISKKMNLVSHLEVLKLIKPQGRKLDNMRLRRGKYEV